MLSDSESMKTFSQILLILFLVIASFEIIAAPTPQFKSYEDCVYETGTGKLNLDQALCQDKGCGCYTAVFKQQIDGLQKERKEKLQKRMITVYKKVSSNLIGELSNLNTIYQNSGISLLGGSNAIQKHCSFNSLKKSLSCKSQTAEFLTKSIHRKFVEDTDYFYEGNPQKVSSNSCLTKAEGKAVILAKERQKSLSKALKYMMSLDEEFLSSLKESTNPIKELEKSGGRTGKRLARMMGKLPLLKNIFNSPSSAIELIEKVQAGEAKVGNFDQLITSNTTIARGVENSLSKKCQQIFQSIDKLACQTLSDPFVTETDFLMDYFKYDVANPEANLESHVFYCKANELKKEKKELGAENLLSSILGDSSYKQHKKNSTNNEDYGQINRNICPLLVCGDENMGTDLMNSKFTKAKKCSPLVKPKRTPMEAYALLGCPDSEKCKSLDLEDFEIYKDYFQKNMVVTEVQASTTSEQNGMTLNRTSSNGSQNETSDTAVTDGDEVKAPLKEVTRKRSDFLTNFMGDVGENLDEFFKEPAPKETQLAKKEENQNSQTGQNETTAASGNGQGNSRIVQGKAKGNPWASYGKQASQGGGFETTHIATVNLGGRGNSSSGKDFERQQKMVGMVDDAISSAKDTVKEMRGLQRKLAEARRNNQNASGGNQDSFRARVSAIEEETETQTFNSVDDSDSVMSDEDRRRQEFEQAMATIPYAPSTVPVERRAETTQYRGPVGKNTVKGTKKGRAPGSKARGSAGQAQNIPFLNIVREQLGQLDLNLLTDEKIEPSETFIIQVAIGKGKRKKMVSVLVENVTYKGRLIMRPIKEKHNKEVFNEVLASPLFENYRTVLSIRAERKKFFNKVLPNLRASRR